MNAPSAYYVYILASGRHGTLYIGVCNDLRNRLTLHRSGRGSQFVKKYGVTRLVYVEAYASPLEAIAREKALKEWRRDWKIRLIEQDNPSGPTCRIFSDSCGYGPRPSPGRRKH